MLDRPSIRFLIVGGFTFVVDYGSFFILFTALNEALYVANSISFTLGLITSFSLNRAWTFSNNNFAKRVSHQFGSYLVLALTNLLMSNVFVGLLRHIGVNPRIGKIITIAVISIWNFFMYKKFIFTPEKSDSKN